MDSGSRPAAGQGQSQSQGQGQAKGPGESDGAGSQPSSRPAGGGGNHGGYVNAREYAAAEPGSAWHNKRAQEDYQRALESVVDRDFTLG